MKDWKETITAFIGALFCLGMMVLMLSSCKHEIVYQKVNVEVVK